MAGFAALVKEYVGREADYPVKGGMVFDVTVVDVRESWGSVQLLVQPFAAGRNSRDQWVALSSVVLREATREVG